MTRRQRFRSWLHTARLNAARVLNQWSHAVGPLDAPCWFVCPDCGEWWHVADGFGVGDDGPVCAECSETYEDAEPDDD